MSAETDFKTELDAFVQTKYLIPAHLGTGRGDEEVDAVKAIGAIKTQLESLRVRHMDMKFISGMIDNWLDNFGDTIIALNALQRESRESFEAEPLSPALLDHCNTVKRLCANLNDAGNIFRQLTKFHTKKDDTVLADQLQSSSEFAAQMEAAVYDSLPSLDNINSGRGGPKPG